MVHGELPGHGAPATYRDCNRRPRNLPRIDTPGRPRGQTPTGKTSGETQQGGLKRSGTDAPRTTETTKDATRERNIKYTQPTRQPNAGGALDASASRPLAACDCTHASCSMKFGELELDLTCTCPLSVPAPPAIALRGWAECAAPGPDRGPPVTPRVSLRNLRLL